MGLNLSNLKNGLKVGDGSKAFRLCSEKRDRPGKNSHSISGKYLESDDWPCGEMQFLEILRS